MAAKQRFERKHLIRLGRLLDMEYRPSEVADEIGVTVETVYRSYLPGGAPFRRDARSGDIWIHGKSFAAWVEAVKARRHLGSLAPGQAWCFKCGKATGMLKPRKRHSSRYTVIFQGRCAECNQVVNRAYAAGDGPAEVEK